MASDSARRRARRILLEYLDQKQRMDYLRYHWFEVVTNKGNHYRISYRKHAPTITLIKDGQIIRHYCSYLREPKEQSYFDPTLRTRKIIPVADNLLIQKFLLETDEDQFLKHAHTWELGEWEQRPRHRIRPNPPTIGKRRRIKRLAATGV